MDESLFFSHIDCREIVRVSERRDDCRCTRFSGLNLRHTLDVDEAAVHTVTASKEGVNAVACIDFVGRHNVLVPAEWSSDYV